MRYYSRVIIILVFGLYSKVAAQNILVNPFLQDARPTSLIIVWEVDGEGKGYIDLGSSPFNLNEENPSISHIGNGSTAIHEVLIENLDPGTKYYYRVRMINGQLSYVYQFRTPFLNTNESATHVIAVSDMQRDGSQPDKWREVIEDGIIPKFLTEVSNDITALDAILIPGDLVATGGNYPSWRDQFFQPADSLMPYVPLYPVPGNHEYFGDGLPNFINYFSLPNNGPNGLLEQAWYKDISNIRIIGLNSNSGGSDQDIQLLWLETILDNACSLDHIDFVFAQLHHPFKSELWTPGENDFTGEVITQLEDFTASCDKPSVHFFGHTHGYSRGQSKEHEHLWVNVATAGGAIDNWGEFPNADYDEFSISQDEYGFVLLSVEAGLNPQFTLKRFTRGDQDSIINNDLVDSIVIKKNDFGPVVPRAIFPDGDSLESQCIVLKGSQFDAFGSIHQASQWQVANGSNFEDSLVVDIWKQNENWYNEVNMQANDDLTDQNISGLEFNESYCWRVRYRNQHLSWSNWSEPKTFFAKGSGADLTGNLILNGGAENGIINWQGDIESLSDNECNSVPVYSGSKMFAVGGVCANEQTIGISRQFVDISSFSNQINVGNVGIEFGGFMRDFSGSDIPSIYVEILDISNNIMAVSDSIQNATDSWLEKTLIFSLPVGSMGFNLVLKGKRISGSDNDSYFDEVYAKLNTITGCNSCFTSTGSEIDFDGDGFCADIDCDDQDSLSFPGALELCDGKDNNCDGKTETMVAVNWTGGGDGINWEDGLNWDQEFIPLRCQHVIVSGVDTVTLSTQQFIASIETAGDTILNVTTGAYLHVLEEE